MFCKQTIMIISSLKAQCENKNIEKVQAYNINKNVFNINCLYELK